MARLIRKTAKVSGSGGGKINVRGREWTKEDLRELKNHSCEKTPAKTIAKLTKRTVGALRQKAFILGLPLGRSSREWTKEDLRKLKRYARQKAAGDDYREVDETNGCCCEAKGQHTPSIARPPRPQMD